MSTSAPPDLATHSDKLLMWTILSRSRVLLRLKSLAVFDFDDGRPNGDFKSRGNEADLVFFFSVESRSSVEGGSDVTLCRSLDFD